MEIFEAIESAKHRYDELGTKPNWRDWYRGYISGAIWAYDKLSPPSCDAATKDIAAREFAKSLYADLEHMRDGHDMVEEATGGDFGDEYKERLRHAAEDWIAAEFKRAPWLDNDKTKRKIC